VEGLARVEPAVAFGRVLKRLRKEKGVTQERLAQESGYHTTYISQIECGKKNPTLQTLFRIAEALEILPQDIISSTLEEIAQPPPE